MVEIEPGRVHRNRLLVGPRVDVAGRRGCAPPGATPICSDGSRCWPPPQAEIGNQTRIAMKPAMPSRGPGTARTRLTRCLTQRGSGGRRRHANGMLTRGSSRHKAGQAFRPGLLQLWSCRESNPGPTAFPQDFSVRSSPCLYSDLSVTRTSRDDDPSRCWLSRSVPRPD